jgi:hypothetical protein
MDRLIKTLPAILRAAGDSAEVNQAACVAAWKHAVGETLSGHAIPIEFSGQTLAVAVMDGIWKAQLEQMRGQLLFRLNSLLGQPLVKSIELRIDPGTVGKARAALARTNAPKTYDVPAELLNAAAEIDDADLRRAFLGAASSCVHRVEKTGS